MSLKTLPLKENQKLRSIDIMRGIAILMVIMVHTSQKVEGHMIFKFLYDYGQMGVQLFFVASAFTLCYSQEIRRSTDHSLVNFYIRRLFRIAPGYYAGIITYYLINVVCNAIDIGSAWEGNYSPINILVNVFFLHGLYPWANNNIVPGGWSIGTEMLFYLFFPLIFFIYKKTQKMRTMLLIIPLLTLFISILTQYIIFLLTKTPGYFANNNFIYFSFLNQLPVFSAGMSLYFAYKKGLFDKVTPGSSLTTFIVLSVISIYLMVQGMRLSTFIFAIIPFTSAVSFVFLFIFLQNSDIKSKVLERIGILSYSGYLLHIIFAYFVAGFLSNYLIFIQPDVTAILLYLIAVSFTFLFARWAHLLIELKGVRLGNELIKKRNQKNKQQSQPQFAEM